MSFTTIFFPVLSGGIWTGINLRTGVQELVGIVLCEVLFLRLCVSFGSWGSKEELLKYASVQVVHAMKAFHKLDMLFKMLLEPSLPVTTLLCAEDAIILHKVLYDAVVLIDYSFYFERWSQSADGHSKKLAFLWLLVADRAIMFARSTNDKAAALSYLKAFRESQIVTEIVMWVKIQTGIEDPYIGHRIPTPRILIEWLFVLENNGMKVFDGTSLLYAKASVSMSEMERDSFFGIVVNKDQETGDPSNNVLCSVDGGVDSKKRKETFPDVPESQLKHAKHDDDSLVSVTAQNFSPLSSCDESYDGKEALYVDSDDDDDDMDDE